MVDHTVGARAVVLQALPAFWVGGTCTVPVKQPDIDSSVHSPLPELQHFSESSLTPTVVTPPPLLSREEFSVTMSEFIGKFQPC